MRDAMNLPGPDTLLEFADVTFRYPDGNIGLDGCSLRIARGSRNALIGANGAGKTTLFQHANGLLRPQGGTIRYAGQPIDYSRAVAARTSGRVPKAKMPTTSVVKSLRSAAAKPAGSRSTTSRLSRFSHSPTRSPPPPSSPTRSVGSSSGTAI